MKYLLFKTLILNFIEHVIKVMFNISKFILKYTQGYYYFITCHFNSFINYKVTLFSLENEYMEVKCFTYDDNKIPCMYTIQWGNCVEFLYFVFINFY